MNRTNPDEAPAEEILFLNYRFKGNFVSKIIDLLHCLPDSCGLVMYKM